MNSACPWQINPRLLMEMTTDDDPDKAKKAMTGYFASSGWPVFSSTT